MLWVSSLIFRESICVGNTILTSDQRAIGVYIDYISDRPDADEFGPHIEASSSFVLIRKVSEVRADREEYRLKNEVGASTVVASVS